MRDNTPISLIKTEIRLVIHRMYNWLFVFSSVSFSNDLCHISSLPKKDNLTYYISDIDTSVFLTDFYLSPNY